ncbi:ArsR/SmtB family transcription factor [Aeromicrobium sp.]|uniref:ArsR/SmtB family transcription factor n=1 Tax=Aeromicrobium sp. TaxID=1871063 RepID=UPI003D6BA554
MSSSALDPEVVLDALGDSSRRRILRVLRDGEVTVGELTKRVPVGRPAVSKHLGILHGAGLVSYDARGTRHLYSLAPEGYHAVQTWLVQTWDTVLDAFAAHVEADR